MKIYTYLVLFCSVAVASQSYSEPITFPVVGDYDGSSQGNVVDRNAAYYDGNSSGKGVDESLIIDIDAFRSEIRAAFSNDCGGVVSFDNGLIAGGTQTDSFIASFGEKKQLVVASVDHLRTDFSATNIFVPISGPGEEPSGGFLAKSIVDGDQLKIRASFDFTFTEKNFGAREHVRVVGGTILGRNGAADTSKWLMKVRLDNGDVIAEIADINFKNGNGRDDTFFGARAPKGRYITGVTWINLDGNYTGLDGFAFITNGSPHHPPPSRPENSGSSTNDNGSTGSYTSLFGSETPSSGQKDFFGIPVN